MIELLREAQYVFLLFGLFVVPRLLQRFRIPTAITSLALGALCGLELGWFVGDPTVKLLSTLGIVSLFLFAGLEVDLGELRRQRRVVQQHLLFRVLMLAAVAAAAGLALRLEPRPALLVALALVTPSTGFILDSLAALGLSERERFWVRSKAVATELIALAVLFAVLQSTTWAKLGVSAAILLAMVAALPLVFRVFAALIVPHAPRSEFAFLIMVAAVCAVTTLKLGVYYLVGAFVVGLVAQRFREELPAMASEKMLHAVEAFASIFVPFYFFAAGLAFDREVLSGRSLLAGAIFLAFLVPLQLSVTALHRRWTLGESLRDSLRVSVPMLPTLVFTLVIASILRERFDIAPHIFGGLMVYTLGNTLIPGFWLRLPPPEFDTPEVLPASQN
jgi:Kef-type K+ transport system membrane component KefB